MIELKKCPFCGKITTVTIATAEEMGDCKDGADCIECGHYCVVCDYSDNGCGASSRYARSPEEAAEAWNRRMTNRERLNEEIPKNEKED